MIVINPTDNRYLSKKPKFIHKSARNVKCETDEFEKKLRKEIIKFMQELRPLGMEITRANPKAIQNLIDMGVLYVGEDNQLHAVDVKENIPTTPTKEKGKDIE